MSDETRAAAQGLWTVHCDGSALPNPGHIGLGAVIISPDGSRTEMSEAAREIGCNNEAELRALMAALRVAQAMGADATAQIQVFCDSRVVVDQLAGVVHDTKRTACDADPAPPRPIARLAPLFDAAGALMAQFDTVDLRWIPQRRNAPADALARAALGITAPRAAPVPARRSRRRKR